MSLPIFLVAIPLGLAAFWLARRAFVESADPHGRNIDLAAQFAGGLALFGLCLGAIEARRSGLLAIGAFATAGAALAAFVFIERRQGGSALVPLDLFRARAFRGAALGTAGMTFAMYGNLFVLPLAWRDGGVLTIAEAGVALVPMALVYVFVAPYAAGLAAKLGADVVGAAGGLLHGKVAEEPDGGRTWRATHSRAVVRATGRTPPKVAAAAHTPSDRLRRPPSPRGGRGAPFSTPPSPAAACRPRCWRSGCGSSGAGA